MFRTIILGLAVLWPVAASSLESTGQAKEKETSELREFSVKPLKVYSARGRRDPFMLPMLEPPATELEDVSLADLYFAGLFIVKDHKVAMFRKTTGRGMTLTLRGGYLYGFENKRLPNFKGKIVNNYTVVLRKGEENITYTVSKEKSSLFQ